MDVADKTSRLFHVRCCQKNIYFFPFAKEIKYLFYLLLEQYSTNLNSNAIIDYNIIKYYLQVVIFFHVALCY